MSARTSKYRNRKAVPKEFTFEKCPSYDIDYSKLVENNSKGELSKCPQNATRELKIVTWNVNGLRTNIMKSTDCKGLNLGVNGLEEFESTLGLGKLIEEHDPDIICMQETRISDELLSKITVDDWQVYGSESKGTAARGPNRYAGVAIFINTKKMCLPNEVLTSLPGTPDTDPGGRFIAMRFDNEELATSHWIVNTYTPNSGTNADYRNEVWNVHMSDFLNSLENVIYCGDLNVARTIYDMSIGKPKEDEETFPPEKIDELLIKDNAISGFRADERTWFDTLLASGFIDTWRRLNPEAQYTGYTHRGDKHKAHMRIDYHLVKFKTMPYDIKTCEVITMKYICSDHSPLMLTMCL